MRDAQEPEWPLTVAAGRVGPQPVVIAVDADGAVRSALARRFDIIGIDALTAEVTLRRLTDGDIAAVARIRARLTQACVVTLEPVEEVIDTTVEGRFSERAAEGPGGDAVITVDPEDESDEPEPIVDGMIPLGEWLAQQVSLELDPYPRAPGAAVDPSFSPAEPEEAPTHRPFARLARLRKERGER